MQNCPMKPKYHRQKSFNLDEGELDCCTNDVSVNLSYENSELNTITVQSSTSSPGNITPINPLDAASFIPELSMSLS